MTTCDICVQHGRLVTVRSPSSAVAGSVDSGKSTLVAVLTHGAGGAPLLDNGRGSARMAVFRHKHEIESGRTSSISQQILGYDAAGAVGLSQDQYAKRAVNGLTAETSRRAWLPCKTFKASCQSASMDTPAGRTDLSSTFACHVMRSICDHEK